MRKKVLFIIWSFSMGGGAEKILANILNNIDLNKYEIDVLEYIHFDVKQEIIPKEINRIRPILNYNETNKYKRYLFDKLCLYFPSLIRKAHLRKKYDIEISFNEQIPSYLLDQGAITFCWIHSSMYGIEKFKKSYIKQLKVFKSARKIIAISEMTEKSISDIFPEVSNKIIKIYNGFTFENIINKSNEHTDIKLYNNSLVLIGRLDERKQPLKSIECLRKLHDQACNYHLYILGQGELLNQIENQVKKYNLEKYVHILGYIQNPYPIIKQGKAIVSFSSQEGFPTIFVEGLTVGVPFVSSEVGGAKELSNGGKCGIVYKTIDEACNILKQIYNKKIIFKRDECQQFIIKFSIENQIINLENLLDNECGENKV